MPEHDEPDSGRPTTDRVRSIFTLIADKYDLFNRLSSFGIDRSWRRTAVEMAQLGPGVRVLDLCAGTGDLSFAMALGGSGGPPAEVVGTDFVPEMLAVAEKKLRIWRGSAAVRFQQADAQELPFDDASFAVVTVAFAVRNLPNRAANLAEVLRVLKPGGRYVILEFSRPTWALWRALYHFYLAVVIPTIGGLLTRDRASFVYLNKSIRQFPTQPQLAAELRAAGFSAITWRDLTGGIVAVHVAVK